MAGSWLLPSRTVAAVAVATLSALGMAAGFGTEITYAAGCKQRNAEPREITARDAQRAVICLINKKRTKHGLAKLDPREELTAAARKHSRYMRRHGCFSHQCAGEPDLGSRLRQSGYLTGSASAGYGENIAWGGGRLGKPRSIVASWMDSSRHRANILSREFEHIGVGVAWGSPTNPRADAGLYTADFGYRG